MDYLKLKSNKWNKFIEVMKEFGFDFKRYVNVTKRKLIPDENQIYHKELGITIQRRFTYDKRRYWGKLLFDNEEFSGDRLKKLLNLVAKLSKEGYIEVADI